ncbi:hypothetical protein AMAG_17175 [Allomyces macrogynus ATCC 38327]|uniref:Uncharacterized protein n=1 Tax=Allomyces macrogynus (strain ATCC 38327) TaxID=578462 RepID=A0A0L0TDH7_ALLM3|nr:hypothetical protein AMAG_17175 [Allomyces macrogynus ATCC 38327]|eukprot:KNE72943.1 hypothetical protein AMAG_17175 [Allomyces macrogynus ATCC 38327]
MALGTPLPVPIDDELLALALSTPLPATDPLESLLARGIPTLVVSPATEYDQTVFAFPRPLQVPAVVVTECELPVRDVGPIAARPVGPIERAELVERAVARADDDDEAVAWEWTATVTRSDDAAIEIPSGWVRFDGTSKDEEEDDDTASVDSEVETDAYLTACLDDDRQRKPRGP